jgi:flavodoxin/NAD-dependent dihydropyrimidine dehydrogenase PreA subunit
MFPRKKYPSFPAKMPVSFWLSNKNGQARYGGDIMEKGIVLYSSQNGSTKKVAERICAGLTKNGCQADMAEINDSAPRQLAGFDFIGIGAPVYMFRPSYKVTDYIDLARNFSGKPVFTFVTYGSEVGDGANWLRKKLAGLKVVDMGHFQCCGRHLFPGYTGRGYVFSPSSPTEQELSAAETFGETIASNLLAKSQGSVVPYDPGTHWVSRFERFVTNRVITKIIYSKFFSVSKKLCNSCGICASICPTKNIEVKNDEKPKWGNNCILCCACQIKCPQKAVSTPISWLIFSPFLWYNIIRTKARKVSWAAPERDS